MLENYIWYLSMILEALLLVRGVLGGWAARFRVFYAYIAFVFLQSLLRFYLFHSGSRLYVYVYWITEFLAILIGCAVTFEIYRVGLRAYPGTARMARNVLSIIFILAATKAVVAASNDANWWPIATTIDMNLSFRIVQAGSIVALAALFLAYRISLGKNLRGIALGFGFYLTVCVTVFGILSAQRGKFRIVLSEIESLAYLSVLMIWVALLWSYQPQPEPDSNIRLEQEYQRLAVATRQRLQDARGYVGKAVGS